MLLLPGEKVRLLRWAAFVLSLIPLALSVVLWLRYDPALAGYPFEEQATWYAAINAGFHLRVDGISIPMVLLTTLLTPLALLISWSIQKNVRAYMALFLLLETGMLGVFMALDATVLVANIVFAGLVLVGLGLVALLGLRTGTPD